MARLRQREPDEAEDEEMRCDLEVLAARAGFDDDDAALGKLLVRARQDGDKLLERLTLEAIEHEEGRRAAVESKRAELDEFVERARQARGKSMTRNGAPKGAAASRAPATEAVSPVDVVARTYVCLDEKPQVTGGRFVS